MKHPTAAVILVTSLAAAPAAAQQAEAPQDTPVRIDPVTGRPAVDPGPASAVESAEDAAARMYLNGDSLLRAQQAVTAQPTAAGIDRRTSFFAVPEPEPTVIRPRDLITVIIREESASKSQAKTDLRKQANIDAALREYLRLQIEPSIGLEGRAGGQRLAAEAERRYRADGVVDRKDSFVTRLSAEVVDVKPNGTLVIQARKRIVTDDEEQTFVLTGICRTQDLTADNTILSTQLHDLDLEKHTRGAIRDTNRRGILTRIVDRINPF